MWCATTPTDHFSPDVTFFQSLSLSRSIAAVASWAFVSNFFASASARAPMVPSLVGIVGLRYRDATPTSSRLLERREGGGQEDLGLLREQPVGSARRGPDALLPRVVPHLGALVEARVGPDVDEAVRLAELDATGQHDGRELHPLGKLRLPALHQVGERAWPHPILTH